ncbi:MAG: NYN domain-containing protein [Chloroflexota bacterium]
MSDNPIALESRRIAMLIDGDNAQPSLLGDMLAEAGKYGLVTVRRIYGDWTTNNMGGWKDTLHTYAIQPMQQFQYSVGKNSTDSAMIIDAMDILYTMRVDGFCLVSSDSDYTRLATRIRENRLFVMGIGKKLTPRAFVNACDVFVYAENLQKPTVTSPKPNTKTKTKTTSKPEPPPVPDFLPLFKRAFDLAVQDDGWAFLGSLGHQLRQLDPSFDPRTYGYKQLSLLVKGHPEIFEVKSVRGQGTAHVFVKMR